MIEIPMIFYRQWYMEDVKPNLSKAQKKKLLMKISDYSLGHPITEIGINIAHEVFPELSRFSHLKNFTGIQIFAVMEELFRELNPKQAKIVFNGDLNGKN